MINENLTTGEKEPARWEPINFNSPKDVQDCLNLEATGENAEPGEVTKDAVEAFSARVKAGILGMLLKRKDRAIGYVTYRATKGRSILFKEPSLYIDFLYISPEERGAETTSKTIPLLRQEACRLDVKYLTWVTTSETMQHISDKLRGVKRLRNSAYAMAID